jgi:hypothetical protein
LHEGEWVTAVFLGFLEVAFEEAAVADDSFARLQIRWEPRLCSHVRLGHHVPAFVGEGDGVTDAQAHDFARLDRVEDVEFDRVAGGGELLPLAAS